MVGAQPAAAAGPAMEFCNRLSVGRDGPNRRQWRSGCCCLGLSACEIREFPDHALIDRPLERDDQVGQVLHRLPAPLDEFRLVCRRGAGDVDLALVAGEAQRVPFLRLAAIACPSRPGSRSWAGCRRRATPRSRRASRPSGCWSPRTARAAPPATGPRRCRCRPAASARHASSSTCSGPSLRRPMNTRPWRVEHHACRRRGGRAGIS